MKRLFLWLWSLFASKEWHEIDDPLYAFRDPNYPKWMDGLREAPPRDPNEGGVGTVN